MAEYKEAYKLLIKAEYSNNPSQFLHINKEETGFTLGGIYQRWHKQAIDWDFVQRVYEMNRRDIKEASKDLYWDKGIQKQVYIAFEHRYWVKHKLGQIHSQKVANKLLLAIVNIDVDAVKYMQEVVDCEDDGIIGKNTIREINDESEFYILNEFDMRMRKHYKDVIAESPELAFNEDGWMARLQYV